MSDEPTASRIAGQLEYLFDDEPELRDASDADLADRLDQADREARARVNRPHDSAAEIHARAAGLDRRITAELVAEARRGASPH